MKSTTIRKQFIDYFQKELNHEFVPSAPVIPHNDPTLLFINAGMNQFKSYFLGESKPKFKRAVNSQKCIRVSGKHNDLEEVGRDNYHHTFFEMLGNWSFGDYYKPEAIEWAWKLLTEIYGIDKNRLYATVYKDDDESFDLWKKISGLPKDRILRYGKKDNFWDMGAVGPCGPCSEIHYYNGDDIKNQDPTKINSGDPNYIELWNLVFIQYNRDKNNKLTLLPKKHVDTGAGLERLTATLNNKLSNYETDLFSPIIDKIANISKVKYNKNKTGIPHRVIADHLRMLTFSIGDGAFPSNEGRGYVLRRVLRRAARFGIKLNLHEPFIYKLVPTLIDTMGETFPEIINRQKHIQQVIKSEEKSFGLTLDKGLEIFEDIANKVKKKNISRIPGEDVFKLYDTFGFPVDLTNMLAEEKNLNIDIDSFNKLMKKQQEMARAKSQFGQKRMKVNVKVVFNKQIKNVKTNSLFIGYKYISATANLLKQVKLDDSFYLIFDKTPFYPEGGGQVGDKGEVIIVGQKYSIIDTQRRGKEILHKIDKELKLSGKINPVKLIVNIESRRNIARNHTATHLLQAALREVLGNHVHQSGSFVSSEYLRFDFTHYEKIKEKDLDKILNLINQKIIENIFVESKIEKYEDAIQNGVMALFGEKYSKNVRSIKIGDFSYELCGGTHVKCIGEIGPFIIKSESGVASGIRRIEAITGKRSIDSLLTNNKILSELSYIMDSPIDKIADKVESVFKHRKKLKKTITNLRKKLIGYSVDEYIKTPIKINGHNIYLNIVEVNSVDELKNIGDKVREKLKSSVAIFGTVIDSTPQVLCVVTDDLVKEGIKAGKIVGVIGKKLGGGGGGRPHMAIAGGKKPELLEKTIASIKKDENIKNLL
ncbi:MAG: alanine--tRNA ligase [Candidatus Marinimicrobia bacterium]|nr:alanine--tRNA ligase [Candidatus Neomarinimicrobiota bacterium]